MDNRLNIYWSEEAELFLFFEGRVIRLTDTFRKEESDGTESRLGMKTFAIVHSDSDGMDWMARMKYPTEAERDAKFDEITALLARANKQVKEAPQGTGYGRFWNPEEEI